jgi:hypothetical protein
MPLTKKIPRRTSLRRDPRENMGSSLPPLRTFARRLAANLGLAICLISASLAAGMAGYHYLGGLAWVDAFLNAAMILAGMGPVDELTSNSAKIFAGFYALYSGLLLVATAALILAPVFHRLLHKFHLEDKSDQG